MWEFRRGALQPGAWRGAQIRHLDSRARWVRVAWLLATLRPPHNYVACDVGVKVISLQTHSRRWEFDGEKNRRDGHHDTTTGVCMERNTVVHVGTTQSLFSVPPGTMAGPERALLCMSDVGTTHSLCLVCPRARWPVPSTKLSGIPGVYIPNGLAPSRSGSRAISKWISRHLEVDLEHGYSQRASSSNHPCSHSIGQLPSIQPRVRYSVVCGERIGLSSAAV
jgi:hypothetical protein